MSVTVDNVLRIGQIELRFFGSGMGEERMVSFELTVPPGAPVPEAHYHREVDEFVYALEGTLTYSVDGRRMELQPGDGAFSPRGSVHQFSNPSDTNARALIVLSPGSINKVFFSEVADVVNAGGPPDREKIREIMLRHGLVPA